MTLTQLEYVVAVDVFKSFVAAADSCFVTQPTLSIQIQKLEEELGVKIFDRSRQPIIATEVGERIIKQARVILTESKKIGELIQSEKGELSGELRLGVIPTIAPYLMPDVITAFMRQYPHVTLQIWEYTTERLIEDLKRGVLDCALLSTPINDPLIHEMPLFYERFVAYVSGESMLYKKRLLNANDIASEKLWLLNEGHCMRGQVLNFCNFKHNHCALGNFEYNTGSIETLKRMVDLNAGVTILPELSIASYDEDQMEHIRYFKSPEPVREISLVTTYNYVKKQAVASLKKVILDVIPDKFKTVKRKDVIGFEL